MNEVIGYIVITLFMGGLMYSLFHHISLFSTLKNASGNSRALLAAYLSTIAIAGFLIAFLWNIGIYAGFLPSSVISGSVANAACFLFVGLLVISKFFVAPREHFSLTKHD
ncbi:hypothetical protein [Salimicrobium flavidum]|uniref:Uncharacterized protein n=1 Tax=Salimicrobium flavidum TaxID=570947 RepID=A0A1N7J8F6_9BACI|nr:hypothetical protein [Salimicrobium flavidum]SIS45619.1 hypothetical protein SAMN05421687_104139 [Salimicrobium flavidum]